jgi:predicted Holliday junction resolvase-like endonuclease
MEIAIIIALSIAVILLILYLLKTEASFRRFKDDAQRAAKEGRKEAISQSRAVLGGKFTEQMAPYLPGFNYDPTEARFIGTPVDLIVFPGLSTDEPREVVIMEVKAGKSARLTPNQQRIRELVESGKVRFELLHRPSS